MKICLVCDFLVDFFLIEELDEVLYVLG